MSDQTVPDQPAGSNGQLTQVRVPLEDAAVAFSQRDENGRLPIIVVPRRVSRIQAALILYAVIVLVAGLVLGDPLNSPWLLPLSILVGIVLVVLAVFRSFIVADPGGGERAAVARRALLTHHRQREPVRPAEHRRIAPGDPAHHPI